MPAIEELIRAWDGEFVVTAFDPSGTWIFIAIHDRTLGMAMGGCRFSTYATPADGLRDAMRLAGGMTLKWAAIDFPFGGGKTVLAAPRLLTPEERDAVLLRAGKLIESLGGSYGTGADLGTTPHDMGVIGRNTRWVAGRPADQGGQGDPGPWTALGVLSGLRAACAHEFGSDTFDGRTILVQGLGGVGAPLARSLVREGARILITDAMPARAQALATEIGADIVAPEDTYTVECDIFAPCAIGGILNERSIAQLRCRVVGGSANNQLERDGNADRLHERGILYAPDFIINAGGAIALSSIEMLGWSPDRARERVRRIEQTLRDVLSAAAAAGESPLREANRRAQRNLEAARSGRAAE